jgi:hypothetical protein
MSPMVKAYLETALWSSIDPDRSEETFLDNEHSISGFDPEFVKRADKDCVEFLEKAGPLVDDHSFSQIGHDFWLTRNHHGAGFWDGDYEHGEELTKIAHEFSQIDLYVSDDGRVNG